MRMSMPRVGEAESEGARGKAGGKRFKHNKVIPGKPLDKLSNDYERKTRQSKKKAQERGGEEAVESSRAGPLKDRKGKNASGRYGGKPIGQVRSELKSAEQIRKAREVAERRKAKTARPSRKKGKGKR